MDRMTRIFWLGTKELRAVLSDVSLVVMIIMAFTLMVVAGGGEDHSPGGGGTTNMTIAIVDEDNSALSRAIAAGFLAPDFLPPTYISADEIGAGLDNGAFMFALSLPAGFEADLRRGRLTELLLTIDATRAAIVSDGATMIALVLETEVARFLTRTDPSEEGGATLVTRLAFNPTGDASWTGPISALLDNLSMLTILLTGAALIRERERGTIEHLMVMPLTSFDIALAKIWANGLILIAAFAMSLVFVVQGAMAVPLVGSVPLLLVGTGLFIFATAAIGIMLATLARSMAQFAMLFMLTYLPIMQLSGGVSPVENQPELLQHVTWLLPSRHYLDFANSVLFRAAGFDVVWPQVLTIAGLGTVFLSISLVLFRRSIESSG
ncbi:Inner membrane transport permease YhhJ [Thalassovita gelatinovora]|uniref:Inner membrane transport permease YhhJ n=1 Tax=Thalassovita gelatinovora TaxID=53501 RepID=A0A0P1F5M9_THAGE|nr:ABC transporter permease [Thalassovita gelatinovora]QIZ80780.1 ABC transporter permease [Thalassovita gelatinovora]CUH63155.1 Inner membrane transport permease YhhJ [Thalassovita gelatinovora]SEQ62667.1 ABC-2 type transport system permease protein [Thalassovita gelatinovora]